MKLSFKTILPIILISALLILLAGCFGVPADESPGYTPGTITGIIAAPCCSTSAEPVSETCCVSPEYWCFYCQKTWSLQEGIEVVLTYGEDVVAATTTNEDGEFTFTNVDPGKNYVTTAYCPDFDDNRPLVKDVALELIEGGSFDTKITDLVSTSLGLVVDFLVLYTDWGPEDISLDAVLADRPLFPNFPKFLALIYEVRRVVENCEINLLTDDDVLYATCRAAEEISGLDIGCGAGYTPGEGEGEDEDPCVGNTAPVVNKIEYSDDGVLFTEIHEGVPIHVISGGSYTVRADVSDDGIKDPLTFQPFLDTVGLGTYPYPGINVGLNIPLGDWDIGSHTLSVEFYDGCTKTTWGPVTVNVDPITYDLTMQVSPEGSGTTSPAVGTHNYTSGTVVDITATPASGYQFVNWTGDVADPNLASTSVTMDADKTVTANFDLIPPTQYTLTLIAGPGGSVNDGVNGLYNDGTDVGIIATPDSGYEFTGWTANLGSIGNVLDPTASSTDVTMNEDMTLTANFDLIPPTQYTLTLIAGPGGSVNDGVNGLYNDGTDVGIIATPDSGYEFTGWTANLGSIGNVLDPTASSTDVTMNEDMTLTANFEKITYTLTLNVAPTGSGSTTGEGTYVVGTPVNISASANLGWKFQNWTVDDGSPSNVSGDLNTDPLTVTMNEDMTLTAHFMAEIFILGTVTIAFEDLEIPTKSMTCDYDYNDWVVDLNITTSYDGDTPNLTQVKFDVLPEARGAGYDHRFHISFPADTFSQDGTYILEITGESTDSGTFDASEKNDFVVIPDTRAALGSELHNHTNTLECFGPTSPTVTAVLTIDFSPPFFYHDFSQYDPYSTSSMHGEGLFFDPYLEIDTGTNNKFDPPADDEIHTTDIRMLTVPDDWSWPEEGEAIWDVYTSVTGPPLSFSSDWWTLHNNCIYGDGIICGGGTCQL